MKTVDERTYREEYLSNLFDHCDVTDLQGNHCPERLAHNVMINDVVVGLCEKCYRNLMRTFPILKKEGRP